MSTKRPDKQGHFPNTNIRRKLRYLCHFCVFFASLLMIICIFDSFCLSLTYGSGSPSFTTEEIEDGTKDFVAVRSPNTYHQTNLTKCESIANELHLANINSIKFLSDGRFLNATVFLSSPFSYEPNSTIYQKDATSLDVGVFQPIRPSDTAQKLLDDDIEYHNDYVGFQPIENKTFVTNNYSAYELIYQSISHDDVDSRFNRDTKNADIGIIRGDKFFLFEFSTLPSLFSYKLDILHELIKSIRLSPINQADTLIHDNYSTYNDPTYDLTMNYPSDWKNRSESTFYHTYHDRDNFTTMVRFANSNIYNAQEHYYMLIDVHSTFDKGPDYLVYYWYPPDHYWVRIVDEISSNGYFRDIDSKENIFINNTRYDADHFLSMGFDLQKANYPNEYSAYIYKTNTFDIDDLSCFVFDKTGWIPFPPPKFSISANPNTIELRPNEEKIAKIIIHNNSSLNANFSLNTKPDPEFDVIPIPKVVSLLPEGDTAINLKVKNKSNNTKEPISHMISLSLTTTFPQNATLLGQNLTIPNTEGANTTQIYYYTATTLPNLEAKDYLNSLAEWVSPLNSIWAFFVAIGVVVVPLLIRMYSRRKQTDHLNTGNEKKKLDSHKSEGSPF